MSMVMVVSMLVLMLVVMFMLVVMLPLSVGEFFLSVYHDMHLVRKDTRGTCLFGFYNDTGKTAVVYYR